MSENKAESPVEAEYGKRMISLTVRFWTDDIAEEKGMVIPKHAWASGAIRMVRNDPHGIKPGKPMTFNSLMELPGVIEEMIIREGITLHTSRKMQRYIDDSSES